MARHSSQGRFRCRLRFALRTARVKRLQRGGISLTVAEMSGSMIGFALIPYTYQHTPLRYLMLGAGMNIETDPIARHLEQLRLARGTAAPLKMAELRRQGY